MEKSMPVVNPTPQTCRKYADVVRRFGGTYEAAWALGITEAEVWNRIAADEAAAVRNEKEKAEHAAFLRELKEKDELVLRQAQAEKRRRRYAIQKQHDRGDAIA